MASKSPALARVGSAEREPGKTHYRAVWISDVHLGTVDCKAAHLVEFLKSHTSDTLYLVGDIIDGWKLKQSFYWPQEHTNVIRKILTRSKRGTKVYYVTGNHDEFLRKFVGFKLEIGNIKVVNEVIHATADGKRWLVCHGDAFDVITRYHRWVAVAGDALYENTLRFNYWFNRARRTLRMPYWSLSAFAKQHVKSAVSVVSTFEAAVARDCKRRRLDGVVCGHIHHAEIRAIDGIQYHNCGDWVESCTALVEHLDGRMELVRWVQLGHLNQAPAHEPLLAKPRQLVAA